MDVHSVSSVVSDTTGGGRTHAWAQHCPLVWASSGSLELASAEQNEELGGGM